MRHAVLPLFLAPILPLPGAAEEADPGWTSLFDGESLAGWEGDPRHWSVEDGAIVGRTTDEVPLESNTYLSTTGAEYADFDLRVRLRYTGGNTGVQFRTEARSHVDVRGYQADLDHASDWTGCLYDVGGRGLLLRRGQRVVPEGGTVRVEPLADPDELLAHAAADEWLDLRVVAEGNRIRYWIDGALMCDLVDVNAERRRRSGGFGFQLHAGAPMELRITDVRVRELGGAAAEGRDGDEDAVLPHWIWRAPESPAGEVVRLRRTIDVPAGVRRATLWATCDNSCEVFVGDERVAVGTDWARPFTVDVPAELLGAGGRELRATCANEGGPAAFVARLTLELADGATVEIVTDDSWEAAAESGDDWSSAVELGAWGAAPWGTPSGTSDGRPGAALPADRLTLPPGFEAELVYSVPRLQGSWVVLCVDDRGRALCSDQGGRGLYRLTLPPFGSGARAEVEELDLPFDGAQGLCAFGRDLYVVANGRESGLHRARDLDGDDRYEHVELLRAFDGAGEHGPHAVVLGPDERSLYVMSGNHVELPEPVDVFHMAPAWHEDQLLERMPDPRGHAVGVLAPGGWLARTDLDGQTWEVLAVGMRNAYDVDFDRRGRAFTYDSDMEWDLGAPWYRAPRILELVPGADFGWRHGSGKVPAHAEDTLGGVVDTGPSSPTGVLHGSGGGFHAPWDDVLFAADWAYGTVHAVHLEDDGAGTTGWTEPFLRGKPLPVCDMAWTPEGDMLVLVGGRGTQSGVYRIRSTIGGPRLAGEGDRSTAERSRDGRYPELRPWLDVASASLDLDAALRDLASDDRLVRYAARVALERRPLAEWADAALARELPLRPLGGVLIALARVGGERYQDAVLERIASTDLSSAAPADRSRLLRAAHLAIARNGEPPAALRGRLRAAFEPLFPSGDPAVDRQLVELLVALRSDAVTAPAVERMLAAEDQETALHYAAALRAHGLGWTPELVDAYLRFLHVEAATFHGGRSLALYVERIRGEALETVGEGWTPPPAPERVEARAVEASLFVQEWTTLDLEPHLEAVDSDERDLARGRLAFEKARCFECHRYDGEGGSTGPDLTGAGNRFSVRDMLVALLEPSRDVSDQYQDEEIWTTDGLVYVGRVEEEDDEWLTLRLLPPREDQIVDVPVDEVRVRRKHPASRMPAGLLDGLRREEILDLLAYVLDR